MWRCDVDKLADQVPEDVDRLNSCLDDLISIGNQPTLTTGNELEQTVLAVLDTLRRVLRLDIVCARFNDPETGLPRLMVRVEESLSNTSYVQDIISSSTWLRATLYHIGHYNQRYASGMSTLPKITRSSEERASSASSLRTLNGLRSLLRQNNAFWKLPRTRRRSCFSMRTFCTNASELRDYWLTVSRALSPF